MTPKQIRDALEANGSSQAAIARKVGVSEMMVSYVVRQKKISQKIMKAIAAEIKRDVREVFFDYYFNKTTKKRAA